MTDTKNKTALKLRWADWAAKEIKKLLAEEQEINDLSELSYFKKLMEIDKFYNKINGTKN